MNDFEKKNYRNVYKTRPYSLSRCKLFQALSSRSYVYKVPEVRFKIDFCKTIIPGKIDIDF